MSQTPSSQGSQGQAGTGSGLIGASILIGLVVVLALALLSACRTGIPALGSRCTERLEDPSAWLCGPAVAGQDRIVEQKLAKPRLGRIDRAIIVIDNGGGQARRVAGGRTQRQDGDSKNGASAHRCLPAGPGQSLAPDRRSAKPGLTGIVAGD